MKRLLAFATSLVAGTIAADLDSCKCLPGDACWPSTAEWSQLNATVGGRLIATVPLGQVCHDPSYNASVCNYVKAQWNDAAIHMDNSASIMSPLFANQSCDPFTPRASACRMGNYVRYAVDVRSAADVVAAMAFARAHRVRFVIRNTGHDYLGRSTGAGALSVWTHHLKAVDFLDWHDDDATADGYRGKAVRIGAGVQGYDLMAATRGTGLVVVGGECPTVGPAGGYTQGGGHSALSGAYGLSADNVLEWDVVTADGTRRTASRTQNPDLYWALSGGGPGNFGVVLSMTVRAHRDAAFGGASVLFSTATTPVETFWKAVDAFHAALPALVDAGAMAIYDIVPTSFVLSPLVAYNRTGSETRALLAPFLDALEALHVPYLATFSHHGAYYDFYNHYFGPLPLGQIRLGVSGDQGRVGGRLIPRAAAVANVTGLGRTARLVADRGAVWVGVAADVSRFGGGRGGAARNAVNPAWREALVHVILTTPLRAGGDDGTDVFAPGRTDTMTAVVGPALEAFSPGGGAYMNEADFRQPDFQRVFFGSHYPRLLEIKKKYDPEGFFYAVKAVGSEAWEVAADGRMCRVRSGAASGATSGG